MINPIQITTTDAYASRVNGMVEIAGGKEIRYDEWCEREVIRLHKKDVNAIVRYGKLGEYDVCGVVRDGRWCVRFKKDEIEE